MSLEQLLASLDRLRDPSRPVRIVAIGISKDSDSVALQKIAHATGGQSYLAEDPQDILLVLAQALLAG